MHVHMPTRGNNKYNNYVLSYFFLFSFVFCFKIVLNIKAYILAIERLLLGKQG